MRKSVIPWHHQVGYGLCEFGIAGTEVLIRLAMLMFYTKYVGLGPELAGLAIALGIVWDACTDPFMGRLSDTFVIRGQRRRPYLIPAACGLGICLSLLFTDPGLSSQGAKFCWLLGTYVLVNTFLTILSVPHTALATDMTTDSDQRTRLFGWRMLFGNFGLLLATALPAVWLQISPSSVLAPDSFAALVMAGLTLAFSVITFWATKPYDIASKNQATEQPKLRLTESFKVVRQNKGFIQLFSAFCVATFGLTINSSLALYYYEFYLALPETSIRVILAVFMLLLSASIPLWIWVSGRGQSLSPHNKAVQKISAIKTSMLFLGSLTAVVYLLFPTGHIWPPLVFAIPGGILVGSVVLLEAAVADLGESQPEQAYGLLFGFWKMGGKMSRALSMVATGIFLKLVGYEGGSTMTDEAALATAWAFGPGVGLSLVLAALMLHRSFKARGLLWF